MNYQQAQRALAAGQRLILDGGTGTELERRGVPMHADAWCGAASLGHLHVLEQVHRDFIDAGADIITANTYASSRLLLEPAGLGDQFERINNAAVEAAMSAREQSGREVLIAGSLSHRVVIPAGANYAASQPSATQIADACAEMASLLMAAGCDFLLLEMMYHPERMRSVFDAALSSGLPVWAGFSARRAGDGQVLSYAMDCDVPFSETVSLLSDYDVDVAGVMHTSADLIAPAIDILRQVWAGPLMSYPDSGHFVSPHWQFVDVIEPADLAELARQWLSQGVQVLGGCCGLSAAHITALNQLR